MAPPQAVLDPPASRSAMDDDFELDVQIVTDDSTGFVVRRCDSSDGCGSTCASACSST
jgi:FxLD family lantipeptide